MHYGGSKEECLKFRDTPYMTLKPYGLEIPKNKQLSPLDIETLKKIYAPPNKISPIVSRRPSRRPDVVYRRPDVVYRRRLQTSVHDLRYSTTIEDLDKLLDNFYNY